MEIFIWEEFSYIASADTSLNFKQSIIHEKYLYHLYDLFNEYCPSLPKLEKSLPDLRTGNIYYSLKFSSYTLPCFNELYDLFYLNNKKIIPKNITDLLTPLSLTYWICDDGSWNKINKYVTICTDSFTLLEVENLISVLNNKFNLKSYKVKNGKNYRIIIPSYSIYILQDLISSHIPSMMKHKIGL